MAFFMGAIVIIGVALARPTLAQEVSVADSLVAAFLEHGSASSWQPLDVFRDCIPLSPTQQRAFDLLSQLERNHPRYEQLTLAWSVALRSCKNEGLVNWFFAQLDQRVRTGETAQDTWLLWKALEDGTSPEIRARLRAYIHRTDLPGDVRSRAGLTMFNGIDGAERRAEFAALFRAADAPWELGTSLGSMMVRYDAEWTVAEAVRAVADDPRLADQPLFGQIIVSANQFATERVREDAAARLQAAVRGRAMSPEHADRLRSAVRALRRRRGG